MATPPSTEVEHRKAKLAPAEERVAPAAPPLAVAGISEGWAAPADRWKAARKVVLVAAGRAEEPEQAEEAQALAGRVEEPERAAEAQALAGRVEEPERAGAPLAQAELVEAGRRMAECRDQERQATAAPFRPRFPGAFAGLVALI